jgi:hypothetical protein
MAVTFLSHNDNLFVCESPEGASEIQETSEQGAMRPALMCRTDHM